MYKNKIFLKNQRFDIYSNNEQPKYLIKQRLQNDLLGFLLYETYLIIARSKTLKNILNIIVVTRYIITYKTNG